MAAHRAEIAVPIAVIASRPGGEGSTLAARLRGSWERSGLGAAPARVDLIVLTGGRSDENKIVVLVVADGEEHPRFVVKLPRIERAREGLEREARSLAEVAGTHVPDLATVPRIVLRDEMDGVPFIGETLVEGEPLQATLRAASFPATAAAVADVLAAMVPAMVPAAVADPADIRQRLVEPVIEGFRARFGAVARATEIAAAESCIRALPPLPAVPEQRDCSPWNLLWTGDGRLAILDWESAEPQGLPVLDLCYFLAHAAFLLDGTLGSAREHETYRDLIAGRGPWAPTFRAALDRYCGQVGIDAPTERALRVLGWMIHANVEVDRTGCEAGASVFLSLWRAETEPAR
jgi:aminoglycoside phosphotransferase (APT) family kinase protein